MSTRAFIKRLLKQTAIYWGNPTPDGYGGYVFDTGVEIPIKWEEMEELFLDEAGEEKVSKARAFIQQDIEVGGYLFLGTEADLIFSGGESAGVDVLPLSGGGVDILPISSGYIDVLPLGVGQVTLVTPVLYQRTYRILGYEKTKGFRKNDYFRTVWL